MKPDAVPIIFPKFPQHLQVSPKPKQRSPKKHKIVEPPTPRKIAKEHLYACQSEFDPIKSKQEIVHLKKKVSALRAKIQCRNKKIKNMGDLLKVLKEQKLVSDEKLALLHHNFSGIAKKLFQDQVRNAKVKNKKGNRYNLVTKQFAVSLHYYILHIHESNNGKLFAYIIPVQEYKVVKRSELFGAKKGHF